jgi:hypothetical protein
MKQKIVIKAKDFITTQEIVLDAKLKANINHFTRDEQKRWKSRITNKLFDALRESGFAVHDIKVV